MGSIKSFWASSILRKFFQLWINNYERSTTKKVFTTLGRLNKYSFCHKWWVKYINTRFYGKYSKLYIFVVNISKKVDLLSKKIYKNAYNAIKESRLQKGIEEIFKEGKDKAFIMSMVLISFGLGFIFITIVKNMWSIYRVLFLLLIFVLSFVMLFFKDKVNKWVKNSFIYRVYNYIITE